ncbi:MFS transporter [Baekduia soli]|uniref:MFS transporter n=1 Tax=Baekduia soli TaxID=496014 RepID=A0A5B8U5X5_9ACTN|nr:MFS transporter [Baekduia soli]QEC48238.1 MFS transporter [Baekduia soli]
MLALQVADTSAVGAMAAELEPALGISHVQLGLLASAALLVAGVATLPIGVLADRVARPPLLAGSILVWSLALVGCGASSSFGMLLGARLLLGAVAATAWPVVATLTGDLFAPADRGRVFGVILSGELVGAGFGFLVSGTAAGLAGWRWGFWVLVIPSLLLGVAVWRRLPEPRSGRWERPAAARRGPAAGRRDGAPGRDGGVGPDPRRVLREDPRTMPLGRVVAHVLRVPTNRLLIVASALGYLFIAGEETFGVEFLRRRYELGQTSATLVFVGLSAGAVVGVLGGGRLADRLMARGRIAARPLVAGWSFIVCAVAFLGALALPSLAAAAPAYVLASATLEGPHPPLDAARLDVVPGSLWARAEGVRTLLRNLSQAAGPVMFGGLVDLLGHGGGRLGLAFAMMVLALMAAGAVLLLSCRWYPRDAATAAAAAPRSPG